MQVLKVIAFTHKQLDLEQIGQLHVEDTQLQTVLSRAGEQLNCSEMMLLSTCNRVEIISVCEDDDSTGYVTSTLQAVYPDLSATTVQLFANRAQFFEGEEAVRHLFRVASSIDSLVVGEREIITQVRNAYEKCRELGLTGDTIRLVIQRTIETAKQVYTETHIARNPVSVVSLAYRKLQQCNVSTDARVLVVGAGQTNRNMTRMLKKRGFSNFTVYNRSLDNARLLANDLHGNAGALDQIGDFTSGFDVLITCTGSSEPVVTEALYRNLLHGESDHKVIVDLAIPNDCAPEVTDRFENHYIAVQDLKAEAEANLRERKTELERCETIIEQRVVEFDEVYRHRQIELAMQAVPQQVNAIREKALNEVFARDLEQLDEQSKEVLNNVLQYMQKKYNAVTMKVAKDIMLGS